MLSETNAPVPLQQSMWRLSSEVAAQTSGLSSMMFTGPRGGEGASTLAQALAAGVARYDASRVLLIDADFYEGSLTKTENAVARPGLRDWKAGEPLPAKPSATCPGVDFISAGSDGRATMAMLVQAGAIEAVHEAAEHTYGLVVWDTAPLIPSPDAAMLAPRIDGVVLVVRSGHTLMSDLTQSVEEVAGVKGRLASIVRNRA